MTEENSIPSSEIHKIKLLSTSNQEKLCVESFKSSENPFVKPQTKEKLYPFRVDNFKNYNYDHTTISPTISDFSSIQSNNCGHNSLRGNSGYNETHFHPFNRHVIYCFTLKLSIIGIS